MAITITLQQNDEAAVDVTEYANLREMEIGGKAANGERGVSKIPFYETIANVVSFTARYIVKVTEDDTTPATTLASGRVIRFTLARGEGRRADGDHFQVCEFEDANAELLGLAFVAEQARPEETDVERVLWLTGFTLNGDPRLTTVIDDTTYVPNTNTVTMEAVTYPAGTQPMDVMNDCASSAGKMWFVTADYELYYDVRGSTAYSAGATITDRENEVNHTTHFEPIWLRGDAFELLGQNIATGLVVTYAQERSVYVEDTAAEDQFDYWVENINVSEANSEAQATNKANAYLTSRKRGERSYYPTLLLTSSQVDLVKYGQRISIKSRVTDLPASFDYRRIAELKWEYLGYGYYHAHLTLDYPTRIVPLNPGSPPGPKPPPICEPQAGDTTVIDWDWTGCTNPSVVDARDGGAAGNPWGSGTSGSAGFRGVCTTTLTGDNDSMWFTVTPGDTVSYAFVYEKYGGPTTATFYIEYWNGTGIFGAESQTFPSGSSSNEGPVNNWSSPTLAFTVPTGALYAHIAISHYGFLQWILATAPADPVECDPDALPDDGTSGDSPYYARSDHTHNIYSGVGHTHMVLRTDDTLNGSGATLAVGDVVIWDATADNTVTRTTTANLATSRVGIVEVGGVDGANVTVLWEGISSTLPTLASGSPTDGNYAFTSTTAGRAQQSGTRASGAFGRYIDASTFELWGETDSGGVTDHGALTGLTDDDHTQYIKDAEFTASGDVLVGTGSGTFAARKNNPGAAAAPTTGDDSGDGYAVGSYWYDTTNDKAYVALDVSVGAAVWKEITASPTGGTITVKEVDGSPSVTADTIEFPNGTLTDLGSGDVRYTPSSSGAESWETVVADLSGKVHRWKFEEASGDFNDEISTLDLTATGSMSYSQSSPLGNAVSFTGGYAESSGLGSIPVADAVRTILHIYKRTSIGTGTVVPLTSYGANSTRQLWQVYSTRLDNILIQTITGSLNVPALFGDAEWHIAAAMYYGAGLSALYFDGDMIPGYLGATTINTSSANNFHVSAEYDDTDAAPLTVSDVTIFDRALLKPELDRLYRAFRALLDGS